jgi:tRNA-dihydrouridine synthase B
MVARRRSFQFGPITVQGDLILAPMDGFSDIPFRSLCRQFGSAMSYTAFASAIELLQGASRAWNGLSFSPSERPVVFQIFDSEVDRLTEAARRIEGLGPDAIDINMGCSVSSVSARGAGAGLLRNPEKISGLIKELKRTLQLPVSAKIRLGWDEHSLNYLDVARRLEDTGACAIAVHARTRQQGYGGHADWDAIARIKAAVSIPVIGNGDIRSAADIDQLLARTGCEAVMIGRAAMGNPWIFQRRSPDSVTPAERRAVIADHLGRMVTHYGETQGVVLFRKHLARYLSPLGLDGALRRWLLTLSHAAELLEALAGAFQSAPCTSAGAVRAAAIPV